MDYPVVVERTRWPYPAFADRSDDEVIGVISSGV